MDGAALRQAVQVRNRFAKGKAKIGSPDLAFEKRAEAIT